MTDEILRDLPEWELPGYRDESARLLVRAIHRNREVLLAEHAFVPVQGYSIRGDGQNDNGALSLGALITLWERSPMMQGTCSVCGGALRGFGLGGGPQWFVFAPCEDCGRLSCRALSEEQAFTSLADALDDSVFAIPSPLQFNNMNGQPHSALLVSLRTLGVKALPPEHYGFTHSYPSEMRRWLNPIRAQGNAWAFLATVHHVATGAKVEYTEALYTLAIDQAASHLERTGRLPELDHEFVEGLRITFPLASQEMLRPRPLSSR